jgi:hypothetical protein
MDFTILSPASVRVQCAASRLVRLAAPSEFGLRKTRDRLEAAVGLDLREEDLARAAIVVRTVGQPEAAQIEAAALLHGFDERLARRLALDLSSTAMIARPTR